MIIYKDNKITAEVCFDSYPAKIWITDNDEVYKFLLNGEPLDAYKYNSRVSDWIREQRKEIESILFLDACNREYEYIKEPII